MSFDLVYYVHSGAVVELLRDACVLISLYSCFLFVSLRFFLCGPCANALPSIGFHYPLSVLLPLCLRLFDDLLTRLRVSRLTAFSASNEPVFFSSPFLPLFLRMPNYRLCA